MDISAGKNLEQINKVNKEKSINKSITNQSTNSMPNSFSMSFFLLSAMVFSGPKI